MTKVRNMYTIWGTALSVLFFTLMIAGAFTAACISIRSNETAYAQVVVKELDDTPLVARYFSKVPHEAAIHIKGLVDTKVWDDVVSVATEYFKKPRLRAAIKVIDDFGIDRLTTIQELSDSVVAVTESIEPVPE